jgi:hypothetical protein
LINQIAAMKLPPIPELLDKHDRGLISDKELLAKLFLWSLETSEAEVLDALPASVRILFYEDVEGFRSRMAQTEAFLRDRDAQELRTPIEELTEGYETGKSPESMFLSNLVDWIREKPIDRIMAELKPNLRLLFNLHLVQIAKPGWFHFQYGPLEEDVAGPIREYVKKLSKNSGLWSGGDGPKERDQ